MYAMRSYQCQGSMQGYDPGMTSKVQLACKLKECRFAVVSVPEEFAGGMHLTLASFHAQADVWTKQGTPVAYDGFTLQPHKRRIEHRFGDGSQYPLGALHDCADKVRN